MALSVPAESETRWNKKAILLTCLAVILVTTAVGVLAKMTVLAPESAGDVSRRRAAIDSESNELFLDLAVKAGGTMPWENPHTGKRTLYPAEKCFWTKDGKAKLEPTYVLPRELLGEKGPTLCPDCGKPVVPHNPMPPTSLMVEAAQRAGKVKPAGSDPQK